MRIALAAALTALSIAPRAEAQAELRLPQPTAPEPRVIQEHGESPIHYRQSPRIVLPTLRLGLGYHGRLPVGGFEGGSAFSFDLYGGAAIRFGRAARTGLYTELGYSYVTFSEHLVSLGLGALHGIGPAPDVDSSIRSGLPGFRLAAGRA
jgi:hypothetical protein